MQVIHRIDELRDALKGSGPLGGYREDGSRKDGARKGGPRKGDPCISFVPTMGNLHAGHLSLARRAAALGSPVVASIFVNRLQFAPHEDFELYPRTLTRDCELLRAAGCDIVFAPSEQELYPQPQTYRMHPPTALAEVLEGHFRPAFYVGVCTVVLKLFNIVQPQIAVFGKKDYQQLLVIRGMVEQCALPIEIDGADTVRETTGLALSSRNGYLNDSQRIEAPALHRELQKIAAAVGAGHGDYAELEEDAVNLLRSRGWSPDYVAIRRREDLGLPQPEHRSLVAVAAAKLGNTRLIDAVEL